MTNKPEIIHYCWFGGAPFPKLVGECIESWKQQFPGYETKLWNEENSGIAESIFAKQALEAKQYAFVSDWVRLRKLYDLGGTYFDTDLMAMPGLRELLEKEDNVLGFETSRQVGTAIMSFVPHHPLLERLLKCYEKPFSENGKQNICANVGVLTDLLVADGLQLNRQTQRIGDITVFKRELFFPKQIKAGKFAVSPETVAVHRCTGSWMSERQKRRGRSFLWVKICRPILLAGKSLALKIIGSKNAERLEIWLRNKLR